MARKQFFHSVKPHVNAPVIWKLPSDKARNMMLMPHLDMASIVGGRGTEKEFITLVVRAMVGAGVLRYADNTEELDLIFITALNSLLEVGERYIRLGSFGFSGDELIAVKSALNHADDLQKVATRRQLRDIFKEVHANVITFDQTVKVLRELKKIYTIDNQPKGEVIEVEVIEVEDLAESKVLCLPK